MLLVRREKKERKEEKNKLQIAAETRKHREKENKKNWTRTNNLRPIKDFLSLNLLTIHEIVRSAA